MIDRIWRVIDWLAAPLNRATDRDLQRILAEIIANEDAEQMCNDYDYRRYHDG